MQNILLSLKLVEKFAYNNSLYFHKSDDFFNDEVLDFLKCFYMIWFYFMILTRRFNVIVYLLSWIFLCSLCTIAVGVSIMIRKRTVFIKLPSSHSSFHIVLSSERDEASLMMISFTSSCVGNF